MDISSENMTAEQVLQKVQTSVPFALGFVVENQTDLVIDELKNAGIQNVSDAESAYNALAFLYNNDKNKLMAVLEAVPYNNAINNYTGNLPVSGEATGTRAVNWGNLLGVVGSVFSGVGGMISSTTGLTDVERERLERERILREEEAKRKQTNMLIIGAILLVSVVMFLIYKANKDKK